MKKLFLLLIFLFSLLTTASLSLYYLYFAPPTSQPAPETSFIVAQKPQESEIIARLYETGFIRSQAAFNLLLSWRGLHQQIDPGGYNLSPHMSAAQIVSKLTSHAPDAVWVTIPEGIRKEQTGQILASALHWSEEDLEAWTNVVTRAKYDYLEGVYFPDTYLIPVAEKNFEAASRLINRFQDQFAPYFDQFAAQNILWTTGLKVASLIERETANPADMPIISAVIWNRLELGMPLQIDATLQYVKGRVGDKWWSPVSPPDKRLDSPFNTYLYKGLPPTPICNPGLTAIDAALNPADTDCLFYLHAADGTMYCSPTYAGHLQNISSYLR